MIEKLFGMGLQHSKNKEETAEKLRIELYRPGNLVWGGSFRKKEIAEFVSRGICPAMLTGKPMSFVPDAVCLTMLPNDPQAPNNYYFTHHRAPKAQTRFPQPDIVNIGIIVEPHILLEQFPEAKAIGSTFTDKPEIFDGNNFNAFGIPIIPPSWIRGPKGWEMEVRVPFETNRDLGITPEMWSGIIVGSISEFALPLQKLYKPTFLPDGKLLG